METTIDRIKRAVDEYLQHKMGMLNIEDAEHLEFDEQDGTFFVQLADGDIEILSSTNNPK